MTFHLILLVLCWIFVAITYIGSEEKEGFDSRDIGIRSMLYGTSVWFFVEVVGFFVTPYLF